MKQQQWAQCGRCQTTNPPRPTLPLPLPHCDATAITTIAFAIISTTTKITTITIVTMTLPLSLLTSPARAPALGPCHMPCASHFALPRTAHRVDKHAGSRRPCWVRSYDRVVRVSNECEHRDAEARVGGWRGKVHTRPLSSCQHHQLIIISVIQRPTQWPSHSLATRHRVGTHHDSTNNSAITEHAACGLSRTLSASHLHLNRVMSGVGCGCRQALALHQHLPRTEPDVRMSDRALRTPTQPA